MCVCVCLCVCVCVSQVDTESQSITYFEEKPQGEKKTLMSMDFADVEV